MVNLSFLLISVGSSSFLGGQCVFRSITLKWTSCKKILWLKLHAKSLRLLLIFSWLKWVHTEDSRLSSLMFMIEKQTNYINVMKHPSLGNYSLLFGLYFLLKMSYFLDNRTYIIFYPNLCWAFLISKQKLTFFFNMSKLPILLTRPLMNVDPDQA